MSEIETTEELAIDITQAPEEDTDLEIDTSESDEVEIIEDADEDTIPSDEDDSSEDDSEETTKPSKKKKASSNFKKLAKSKKKLEQSNKEKDARIAKLEKQLKSKKIEDDLDEDDSTSSEDLLLRIPSCTEEGTYDVVAEVDFRDGYRSTKKTTEKICS